MARCCTSRRRAVFLSAAEATLTARNLAETIFPATLLEGDIMLKDLMATGERERGVEIVPVEKRAISNPSVLNEAFEYARPSSFSRGMRIDLNGLVILLISGTASIDEHGQSVHAGDFRAQCRRTFKNITGLLAAEGATWKDVVRTSCYLRDIDRDYVQFNEERTAFYREQGLDPLPASTGIQAKLCRPELLVEIEAIAMFREVPKE
jgi:enamine deaminase RidA (YjgF/YER057c/UK114 family)